MAEPGTDQHQCRIAVRECTDDPRSASYLTIQAFNHVVRSDSGPVFKWKIHIGECCLNSIFNFGRGFF